MLYVYIAAAVVVVLLLIFTCISIIWLSKGVGNSIRQKTTNLISSYDTVLEKKSEELKELEAKIAEALAKLNGESYDQSESGSSGIGASVALNAVERVSTTAYREQNVGQTYQQIREAFTFNTENLMQALAEAQRSIKKGPATVLLESLDFGTVYQLSTISSDHQLRMLWDTVEEDGKRLITSFMEDRTQFGALEFYEWLKVKATEEPQQVKVRVPSGSTLQVPEGVEVVVDNSICEGFQIELNRMIYDYCIKASEVF